MRKINNARKRVEIKTCRQDLSKIDRYVQEVIAKTRKSSDILLNQTPVHLRRGISPTPIAISSSPRGIIHLTKGDLIGIMLGVLAPEEE